MNKNIPRRRSNCLRRPLLNVSPSAANVVTPSSWSRQQSACTAPQQKAKMRDRLPPELAARGFNGNECQQLSIVASKLPNTKSAICIFARIAAAKFFKGERGREKLPVSHDNVRKCLVKIRAEIPQISGMLGAVGRTLVRSLKASINSFKKKKRSDWDNILGFYGVPSNATGFRCFRKCG